MSLFTTEKPTVREVNIRPIRAAGTAEVTAAGVTLTAGDIVLFRYKDKDGTPHCVVATDGDALAVRS